ncbi:MAG TPA: TonB-dependent receptor [Alphaproteobacteria bacterium]|nr:TonB-dependent receptor [Alphaproteobacteria bacterium]
MLRGVLLAAAGGFALTGIAHAQTAPSGSGAEAPSIIGVPPVEVIGTTPLPGVGIDRDKVPANVQSLTSSDLTRESTPSLIRTLTNQASSVNTNDNLVDPFQPDILFRGFEASPVLGTPQGLAVYQNGVRINEAFGDTLNWDLIPDVAIDRVDMISSNPVYGLNALGGAMVITMKNGFTYQGFENEAAGGSFSQRSNTFQFGHQLDGLAIYLAGRLYASDGWREFSNDYVKQLYADFATRTDDASIDVSFSGANNILSGEGTTPEQTLAIDRSLVFTSPQTNRNQLEFVTLNGSYNVTDDLSFQGNAYRREFHQTVVNGNSTNFVACTSGNGLLCQSDGVTPLMTANGGTIPDFSNGGAVPIGENDGETIHTISVGGSLQTSYTGDLFGLENNFVLGGSIDHSDTGFQSTVQPGVINPSLQVLTSGFFVFTPENTAFNPTPVSLGAESTYYGIFATDTFNATPELAVTASGRYNIAEISLNDNMGSSLTGFNRYNHFNPAIGATYKVFSNLTAYAGYAEGNRAPTPSEIECSNPAQPCLLPSSLSSDPPTLKQVISHTYEAGLRGKFTLPDTLPGKFTWNAGVFRTDVDDDIYPVATSISQGFFENIGSTRRQGIETSITYQDDKWSIYGTYSFVDATFQSSFTLPSPNNPFADANGNIHVQPGDHLPGIPENQLKVGADYRITPSWTFGAVLTYFSDRFLRGDESNQNAPIPGYAVLNLHSSYTITENFEIFVNIQNVTDTNYSTFGQYGDPTGVGAPGIPPGAVTNGPGVNNRFLGPGAPLSVFGGVRVRF